jgi:bacteriophage N4 adsorption protein B
MLELILLVLLALLIGGFLISAVDDLVVDLVFWVNRLLGRHRHPPLTREALDGQPHRRAAIFIPAWHEHDVIQEMLTYNASVIDYDRYDIFVGTYPNDPATAEKVRIAQHHLHNVFIAETPHDGPTNKADNLNSMFAEMRRQEVLRDERYGFVVLHDPEDVLHPHELKLYNYYLARSDASMIQTPILPLPAPWRSATGGAYMDEFAELHTKDMHVREWLSGFVPSAGVGTAIRRDLLDELASANGGDHPFATDSLTEDYDLGLRLAQAGHRAMFVQQRLREPPEGVPELIATRAAFPATPRTAVRQRTRWMLGIVFQNWKNRGWRGSGSVRWLLFRDRKPVVTNMLIALGYLLVLYVIAYLGLRMLFFPHWPAPLPEREWVRIGFMILLFVMFHRLLQRAIATGRIYGFGQALLAMPRQVWSNLLSIWATFRATRQFMAAEISGAPIAWDKTQHAVPEIAAANNGHRRIGDILRGWGEVTASEVERALQSQRRSGRRLGEELIRLGCITRPQLVRALRVQMGEEELPYSTTS